MSRNAIPTLLGKVNRCAGQALVEFTLIFLLFLVVAWIPADFGLAFYTGQLAQNASREGARIAAADRNLISGTTSCVMPSCSGNIFSETAARISSALLPGATITLNLDPDVGAANCNRMVTVTVSGTYNFFFYRLWCFRKPQQHDDHTYNHHAMGTTVWMLSAVRRRYSCNRGDQANENRNFTKGTTKPSKRPEHC
jgi:TadE-like protein